MVFKDSLILTCFLVFSFGKVLAQDTISYISHYNEPNRIKNYTLIDSEENKFILDQQRVSITAFDKNGKKLWKTNPQKANKIREYRFKNPQIIYFNFNKDYNKNEVIWITYSNTQSGYIDKKTGKFNFRGQD